MHAFFEKNVCTCMYGIERKEKMNIDCMYYIIIITILWNIIQKLRLGVLYHMCVKIKYTYSRLFNTRLRVLYVQGK